MAEKAASLLNDAGKPVKGSRTLVVGVAYKRDTDDTRESPALDIIQLLAEKGAIVRYHDPLVSLLHNEGREMQSVALEASLLAQADLVVIVTDHSDVDYGLIAAAGCPVLDMRNVLRRGMAVAPAQAAAAAAD